MELTPTYKMIVALVLSAALPGVASAQDIEPSPALGGEVFASTDSDDTDILRTAIDFDLRNAGDDDRIGIRVEKAWYDPSGTGTRSRGHMAHTTTPTSSVSRKSVVDTAIP